MKNSAKRIFAPLAVFLACLMLAAALTGCCFGKNAKSKSSKKAKTTEKNKTVEVVDALNYTKDVIPAPETADLDYSGIKHELTLPKITLETENAKAFNEKMFATFSDEYNALKNDEEGNKLYYCKYEYKIYGGAIGILIEKTKGIQGGGANRKYEGFFYDTDNDKELLFEEYIEKVGITEEGMINEIVETPSFKAAVEDGFLGKTQK